MINVYIGMEFVLDQKMDTVALNTLFALTPDHSVWTTLPLPFKTKLALKITSEFQVINHVINCN